MGTKIMVDLNKAEVILRKAYVDRYDIMNDDEEMYVGYQNQKLIGLFVGQMGKTYRYIFVTELLAKTTNEKANPIVIQQGSELDGAYDARSLCHKVIVKNQTVNALLGNSNEPFLNKPARIPSLDKQVAFKGKEERNNVQKMISFLSSISTSGQAYHYLQYSLYILDLWKAKKDKENEQLFKGLQNLARSVNNKLEIQDFYDDVLDESCEGESLTLVLATALRLFYVTDDKITVELHPSNESGASSREIEDIDLYKKGKPFCCIELKDKNFDVSDIRAAFLKVAQNQIESLLFVVGPNGTFIGDANSLDSLLKQAKKANVDLQVVKASEMLAVIVNLIPGIKIDDVIVSGQNIQKEIRTKESTNQHWEDVAKKILLGKKVI